MGQRQGCPGDGIGGLKPTLRVHLGERWEGVCWERDRAMKRRHVIPVFSAVVLPVVVGGCFGAGDGGIRDRSGGAETVRELMWVWGNPEMGEPGVHGAATFAQAAPARRAKLLGVPNVVMAGYGLPDDDRKAEAWTKSVAHCPRLIWEIMADGGEGGPPWVYRETVARVRGLVDRYPQIEGVLLDDMSSVGIDHGFKPEHIRQVRELLSGEYAHVELWGVVYTMNLDRENINDYIAELDVINLWTWHAKDIVDLEKNVAHCERLFPGKPIVVGLYLYDYGDGRRIPTELLEEQCSTALKLAHARRIQGIVFLTINNDPDAVAWTADWVERVGGQRIGLQPRNGS